VEPEEKVYLIKEMCRLAKWHDIFFAASCIGIVGEFAGLFLKNSKLFWLAFVFWAIAQIRCRLLLKQVSRINDELAKG